MAQEKSRLPNIFVTDDKSWVFQNDAAIGKRASSDRVCFCN